MGKIFLAIWIFLSSLFGANHLATSPTATPNPILAFSEMPDEWKVSRSITPLYLKTNNPMVPFKTVSDSALVQKNISYYSCVPCAGSVRRVTHDEIADAVG
jgi:hypothetical protein